MITTRYPAMPIAARDIPTSSPWGAVQDAQQIAPGIIMVSTASHGGIKLSIERYAEMLPELRQTAYSSNGWFEEDCDWALVAVAFPDVFTAHDLALAKRTIAMTYPDLLGTLNEVVTDTIAALLKQEPSAERDAALRSHRDMLPIKVAAETA